jgi:cyanophycin synthetase
MGPTTASIVAEAKKRNIPYRRISGSEILFGQGINQQKVCASIAGSTSYMAVELAGDKDDTKRRLAKAYIPVPEGKIIRDKEDLKNVIEELGYPLVIKPVDGNHGRGVVTNIQLYKDALKAFELAKEISSRVIVENFVVGDDYRFLVINYKLVAVAKRIPAMVTGNGISTIQQLIDEVNRDPSRGKGHEKNLTTIKVDQVTQHILASKKLSLQSILAEGEMLFLKDTANLSTGGTSCDVTDQVHPHNRLMAERIARITGLNICGIDVVASNVELPITKSSGAIIEVNACPGFRMHLAPTVGTPRNVGKPVIDMLYPEGAQSSRIPVVAVTGTNGKTTSTRLIAHLAKYAGHQVGFTTTDGIYLRDQLVHSGDCTGPASAERF